MEHLLEVTELVKIYGKRGAQTRALDGVSLTLAPGEYVGVMGPSGSGKTTLLNCVATIDRPSHGSIRVEGQELTTLKGKALTRFRRERLGFIFQDCNLLDTLTAFDNIALSLSIAGTPAGEIRPRVEEMAQLLGIGDCLNKYPYQMSGGQQQRCAIGRALVKNPGLLLCDEPTGALDYKTSKEILQLMEDVNRTYGCTIIIVTHNAAIARMANRVLRLRDGRIVEDELNDAPVAAAELDW